MRHQVLYWIAAALALIAAGIEFFWRNGAETVTFSVGFLVFMAVIMTVLGARSGRTPPPQSA